MTESATDPTNASTMLDHMTLDQQIGQLFMVGFSGTSAPPAVLDLIATQHVGGIILFARNLRDADQTLALTRALQATARAVGHPAPLLIATDQENGIVRRLGPGATVFPGQMAQGAVADEGVTRDIARATGEELRALGITMNLAPVVDVANNPANPVIGVRSFGADPDLVARLGVAALDGYAAAGVAATLKHFPGHGDTATDSHLALPVIPHDMERLRAVELVPFRRGVAAGAPVVMTAHIALPVLTGSATLPATLAPAVLHGLLREHLGFDGVVMTDCLEMKAISATVGVAAGAVLALKAGADLVLISHRHDRQVAGIAAVRAAVADGALAPGRVRESAERVLRLKARLCSWADWDAWDARADARDATDAASVARAAEHRALAEAAYARTITLIRDDARALPLVPDPAGRVLIVARAGGPVNQAAGARPGAAGTQALAAALR
ncbi:MAG TPA: glycoside hydrolase family 3 protein, partial [Ktedonobacterales bacterium]